MDMLQIYVIGKHLINCKQNEMVFSTVHSLKKQTIE